MLSHPYDFTDSGIHPVFADIIGVISRHKIAANYSLKMKQFEKRVPLLRSSLRTWDLSQHEENELVPMNGNDRLGLAGNEGSLPLRDNCMYRRN